MSDASITLGAGIHVHGPLWLRSDDALARLAAKGEQRAFATIYERHHQGLYRYCRSIVRNDEDARDALQSAMAKALAALPGETREITLKPWLYRIARNESISLLRRRAPASPVENVDELVDPRHRDEETRDRLRNLVSDLAELPEKQRSALVMRELTGLDYDEIGTALDSSPSAAKQSVYEARDALHQLEEGRGMACEAVRRSISADDRRVLRGRRLRAHLRSCGECRAFERGMRARRGDLSVLAPPLPAAAAAALLKSVLAAGGGAAGGGGLAAAIAGGGASAGGTAALKAGAALVAVLAGVGAYEAAGHTGSGGGDRAATSPVASAKQRPGSAPVSGRGSAGGGDGQHRSDAGSGGSHGSGGGSAGTGGGQGTAGDRAVAAPGAGTGTGAGAGAGTGGGDGGSGVESVTDTVGGGGGLADTVNDVVDNTTNNVNNSVSKVNDTVNNVTSKTGLGGLLPKK